MAGPELNRIRLSFGLDAEPPFVAGLPFEDPKTIEEQAENDRVRIHNLTELGLITMAESQELIAAVEGLLIGVGEGFFDRYGPPPAELDYLYEGDDRYWEKPVGER